MSEDLKLALTTAALTILAIWLANHIHKTRSINAPATPVAERELMQLNEGL